jgi:hypothetical protein
MSVRSSAFVRLTESVQRLSVCRVIVCDERAQEVSECVCGEGVCTVSECACRVRRVRVCSESVCVCCKYM